MNPDDAYDALVSEYQAEQEAMHLALDGMAPRVSLQGPLSVLARIEIAKTLVAHLRAKKNQLQQELYGRPER